MAEYLHSIQLFLHLETQQCQEVNGDRTLGGQLYAAPEQGMYISHESLPCMNLPEDQTCMWPETAQESLITTILIQVLDGKNQFKQFTEYFHLRYTEYFLQRDFIIHVPLCVCFSTGYSGSVAYRPEL